MTTSKLGLRVLVLSESKQWDSWLYLIKSRAQQDNILHLVDPALPQKPVCQDEPDLPDEEHNDVDHLLLQLSLYNIRHKKWYRENQALANLVSTIQQSISPELLPLLQNEPDSHPYTLLRALQANISPPDQAPHTPERWLQELEEGLIKGKARNLPEETPVTLPCNSSTSTIQTSASPVPTPRRQLRKTTPTSTRQLKRSASSPASDRCREVAQENRLQYHSAANRDHAFLAGENGKELDRQAGHQIERSSNKLSGSSRSGKRRRRLRKRSRKSASSGKTGGGPQPESSEAR